MADFWQLLETFGQLLIPTFGHTESTATSTPSRPSSRIQASDGLNQRTLTVRGVNITIQLVFILSV